jgi:glycosyltransferase involved in cell wall biosynthesis
MKIAIIGSRGIPNQYGGFEELAEHLSIFLAKQGHDVYVYNSHKHPYTEDTYEGVNIVRKFDPENSIGTAGQFIYDLNSILDCRRKKVDIVLQLGYTSSSVWYWLMPKNARVVTNMDGLEWMRSKYSSAVKKFLKRAEALAAKHSHLLIADNPEIEKYLSKKYRNQKIYIPYGANIPAKFNEEVLKEYGLEPKKYLLAIARIEPENNIETIIKGVLKSKTELPLILIGNFNTSFGKILKKKYKDTNTQFISAVYDKEALNALRYFSNIYFHGHSVGGTNPSLLEAMACQCVIAAHQNEFNHNTLDEDAYYFLDDTDIANGIANQHDEEVEALFIKNNLTKIRDKFNWRVVSEQYEVAMQQLSIG